MEVLGRHTAVSYLADSAFRDVALLADNAGALPPLVIAVGDARRVIAAASVLRLEPAVFLHEIAAGRGGLAARGRVHLLLGLFRHAGRAIPLLIAETQMGMPATEIILREVLGHCRRSYRAGGRTLDLDAVYVVRAGTAGGINAAGHPPLAVGDLVDAEFTLGWSGTLLQTMGGLELAAPQAVERFRNCWRELGLEFTGDGRYPVARSWPGLVAAIEAGARERGCVCHRGGNLSKDSLYAEAQAEEFVALRQRYGVLSTEMEQLAIAAVAAQMSSAGRPVRTALAAAIVGLLPGESLAPRVDDRGSLDPGEAAALEVAAHALWLAASGTAGPGDLPAS